MLRFWAAGRLVRLVPVREISRRRPPLVAPPLDSVILILPTLLTIMLFNREGAQFLCFFLFGLFSVSRCDENGGALVFGLRFWHFTTRFGLDIHIDVFVRMHVKPV